MKYIRKLIAVMLCLVVCTQMVTSCFAYSDSANPGLVDVSLSMIAETLANDPDAVDLHVTNNVLTYKMFGTVNVQITETVDDNGVRYLDIIEGTIHNNLCIDADAGKISIDGKSVKAVQRVSYERQAAPSLSTLSGTDWVYSGVRDINIVAEDAIRNLAANTMLTLLLSAMGGIGVAISLAMLIINAYQDSTSKTVYARRTTYFEEHYWAYKYVDRYYSNAAHTFLVETVETEHWE